MLSRIFLAIFVFVPALAFASFSDEDMNKELAGRYKLEVSGGPTIQFLLRSSGSRGKTFSSSWGGSCGTICCCMIWSK